MLVYANFGEWAQDQALAESFDGIRCDESNGQAPDALVATFTDRPLRPLFLAHTLSDGQIYVDHAVQARLTDPSIELFNELEGGRVTPEIYVRDITALYEYARVRRQLLDALAAPSKPR